MNTQQPITCIKVHVQKKGGTLGRVPGLLLGDTETGILIRTCTKVGCSVPVGCTRACDMDILLTGDTIQILPTKEEMSALGQLSVRLGSYEEFYKLAIPTGVDPLFIRYQEFFPGRFGI